jgi:hypothetical protein
MHYGANLMGTLSGAGPLMWEHLTTAKLNSQGAVSGGHDEKVFLNFIAKNGLKILTDETDPDVPQPPLPADEVHKVRYGTYTISTVEDTGPEGTTSTRRVQSPNVIGTKTLIRGLRANERRWMDVFQNAVWRAVADQRLTDGLFFARDSEDRRYAGFWTKGEAEVTSMWPEDD